MSVEPSPEEQERLTCLWIWLVGTSERPPSKRVVYVLVGSELFAG